MKYKTLKFGHCYINKEGDFAIIPLSGSKRFGYKFIGTHVNPLMFLHDFQMMSRMVDNDGNWTEIPTNYFNIIAELHSKYYKVSVPQNISWHTPPTFTITPI